MVEELLNLWSLDDYEQSLEELEEVLIVSVKRWGRGGVAAFAGAGHVPHAPSGVWNTPLPGAANALAPPAGG